MAADGAVADPVAGTRVRLFTVDQYERMGEVGILDDTLLVIEVAESSLRTDRLVKLPIYARQGVAEVWIVDIAASVVHGHTDPVDGAFREARTARGEDVLTPRLLPDLRLTPVELLGD